MEGLLRSNGDNGAVGGSDGRGDWNNSKNEKTDDGEVRAKKRRIIYDKEFLLQCQDLPSSKRKPTDFPLADVVCTLGAMNRVKPPTPPTFPPVYLPPRRATQPSQQPNRGGRKEFVENISLRPHGQYSSGTSPGYNSKEPEWFGGHNPKSPHEMEYRPLTPSYPPVYLAQRHSNQSHRVGRKDYGDNSSSSKPHNHNQYSGRNSPPGFNSNKEPEWFSGGPSSRHETMELRGFLDDDRREKSGNVGDSSKGFEKPDLVMGRGRNKGNLENHKEEHSSENASGELNLSLDNILKMENIPGLAHTIEEEQPRGMSRFSQIFQRNSDSVQTGPTEGEAKALVEKLTNSTNTSFVEKFPRPFEAFGNQRDVNAQELGNALRSMLHINSQPHKSHISAKNEPFGKPGPYPTYAPRFAPHQCHQAPPKLQPKFSHGLYAEDRRVENMGLSHVPTKEGLQALLQNLLVADPRKVANKQDTEERKRNY